jgi:hypothetical protein
MAGRSVARRSQPPLAVDSHMAISRVPIGQHRSSAPPVATCSTPLLDASRCDPKPRGRIPSAPALGRLRARGSRLQAPGSWLLALAIVLHTGTDVVEGRVLIQPEREAQGARDVPTGYKRRSGGLEIPTALKTADGVRPRRGPCQAGVLRPAAARMQSVVAERGPRAEACWMSAGLGWSTCDRADLPGRPARGGRTRASPGPICSMWRQQTGGNRRAGPDDQPSARSAGRPPHRVRLACACCSVLPCAALR